METGKLETLKNLVADWFQQAEDKADIEKLSAINKAIEDVKVEQDNLVAENKELLKDYKEIITHTSFNDQRNQPQDTISGGAVSFEDALQQFMSKK